MSAIPHNIEASAFRRGEYVGYAPDGVWRVRRRAAGGWSAAHRDFPTWGFISAPTLAALGAKLETAPRVRM